MTNIAVQLASDPARRKAFNGGNVDRRGLPRVVPDDRNVVRASANAGMNVPEYRATVSSSINLRLTRASSTQ
jgi:hypothetical protein